MATTPHGLRVLWLLPEATAQARLQSVIDAAARDAGAAAFIAHMTLASGRLPPGDAHGARLNAAIAALAAAQAPLVLSARRLRRQPLGLKAQYLSFDDTPALRALMDAGAAALGQRPRRRDPHVSLSYGPLPRARAAAITHFANEMGGAAIRFDRLCWAVMDDPVTAAGVAAAKLSDPVALAGDTAPPPP